MKIKICLLYLVLCCVLYTYAQPNKKFGVVTPQDFVVNSSLIDASTNAIILYNVGSCEFDGNDNGGFSILYTKHVRIKILNRNGYHVSTINEFLYTGDSYREETMENIKASTFNLENNVVQETKLDKKDITISKTSRSFLEKILLFPSVKEGSIIEYSYTIRSEYISHLRSWKFESKYPCLYNEYTVAIPSIYNYIADVRENIPLEVSHRSFVKSFMIGSSFQTSNYAGAVVTRGTVTETKWIAKNIPHYTEEPFLKTINNYISKVDFQLSEIRIPDHPVDYTFNTWPKAIEKLKENEYFGKEIYSNHQWLKNFTTQKIEGIKDDLLKAKVLYRYINEFFSKTDDDGIYLSDNTRLKDIFNNKKGTEAELNMLYIAMLRSLDIKADPAILSTRDNGIANPYYPILNEYNYLITAVVLNNNKYLLDVSVPYLGFNKLPFKCFNGYVRIMSDPTYSHFLVTDTIKEVHNVNVAIYGNSNGNGFSVDYDEDLGYYKSLEFRENYLKKDKKEIEKYLLAEYPIEVSIANLSIDSLHQYDKPVKINYSVNLPFNEDIIYLNPLLNCTIKENPFKSTNRKYPIEKSFPDSLNYAVNIIIPEGYKVEELPKSIRVKLMENMGEFNYVISATKEIIQLNCILSFDKATFAADEYQFLRDFYTIVVGKMSEQIVFKKNKN